MQNLRKQIKSSILFVFIFSILFCFIQLPFYSGVQYGYQYKNVIERLKYLSLEERDSMDVIFLGDSEGMAAFDPLALWHAHGITSYNLCTTFQWAIDTHALSEKMYQYQKPKVVVLEANFMFSLASKKRILLSKVLPLIHYHEIYKELIYQPERADRYRGFSFNPEVVPYTGEMNYMETDMSTPPLNPWIIKYITKMKAVLDRNNTNLVVVSTPNAINWTHAKHHAVQTWCDENQVPYIDYNLKQEELNFDWKTDTRDGGDHISCHGAEKLMNVIGAYLKNNYGLKDHRGDVHYQIWENDYRCTYGGEPCIN